MLVTDNGEYLVIINDVVMLFMLFVMLMWV